MKREFRTLRRLALLVGLALAATAQVDAQVLDSEAAPRALDPVAVVRAYHEAFNAKDLNAMTSYIADDVVWIHVSGDSIDVGGRGADAFRQLLARYVAEVPSARSSVSHIDASGPWVTVHDHTRWAESPSDEGGQSSIVVYEVREGRIQRIWYYPAVR